MSTDIAVRGQSSDLTITDGQTFWTDKQIATLKQLGVENAANGDLAVFFHQSVRTGLDPFARQIYMIGRNQKNQKTNQWETKYTIQTGIDGYRLIARRVVDARREILAYEDTLWCDDKGQWVDVWLSEQPPAAAKVTVLRNGARFSAVALWREYVQTTRDGSPNSMWSRMGSGQLAKCAEALALRKAFPQDLSGIYTTEEMGQADARTEVGPAPAPAPRPSASARLQSAIGRSLEKAADDADLAVDVMTGEVIEAEIVPEEPTVPLATRPQLTAINAALGALYGFSDRADKLAYLSGEFGREFASSAELTKAEASQLIDKLNRAQAEEDAAAEALAANQTEPEAATAGAR
jgi:phage recombination protein Bet